MKKKVLLFISLLAISQLLLGQATINCFPGSDDYHTGSTDGTDFTQTSLIKTMSGGVEAGWARFDVSGIPAGSTIQTVELNIYVTEDNNAYWQVMSIEDDPLLGTASTVYADCTDGDIYAAYQGDFPQPSWFITDLGTEAVSDLQAQFEDGWFATSIWEYETGGTWAITCDGWNETNPPFVVVTYLVPGAPLPAHNPYPPHNSFSIDVEVDLTWDFGDATETYDLYFGTDFPPTTKVIDNATSGASGVYDPGTMEFTTAYYWQVVSKNSAAELETPGPVWTFTTVCDVWAVPFFEDFSMSTPPALPYCWSGIANSVSGFAVVETLGYNGINGGACVQLNNSDDVNAEVIFISPQIEGGVAGKYVNFYTWGYTTLSIGTISDPALPETYTEFTTVIPSANYLDYQEFEVFFTNYSGTDEFIAFKALPEFTYQNIYIDDILIDVAPTCPKPSDLYSAGSTMTTATLGWTENGSATQWNIEYGLFGFTPTGIPNAAADSNPFELTGLTESTVYQFYVQADCGGGDVSYWVGPYNFQTQCDVFDVPYFEGFEAVTPPDLPTCNIVENTNGDANLWYTTNDNAYEGSNSIRVNYNFQLAMDDWFFSPPINLLAGETYIVQFYYTSNSSFYIEKMEVMWGTGAVSSSMTNGPIFTDTLINYAFTWYEGVGYFTPATDGVYYVGWHGYSIPNQFNLYVDDIIIDVAPTCLKPAGLYTLSATSSTATIGWTENGEATEWNIEYGYAGFTPTGTANATANANPFDLTGLEAGTAYDFYVQADCGGGDVSWWAGPSSFTTLCDLIDVPVEENFDAVFAPELPDCWRSLVEASANATVNTVAWNAYSLPNALQMENSGDPDATIMLISPPISETEGVAGKWIRFYAWGYAPELAVGTMTNPFDASTFNAVSVVPLSANYLDYQEYEVYFTNYTGSDEFIAFKGVFTGTYQTIYIDDILIDHPPSCPKPTDLFVNDISTSTALLNWTENGTSSLWNIEYGYAGFVPSGNPTITVDLNPYELTGLESGTAYDFYVQADCGAGDLSDWAGPYNFITLCEPFDVPIIEDFDAVAAPELPPCWAPLVESTSIWATIETITWNSYSAPNSLHLYNSDDPDPELMIVSPMLLDPVNELWINFFASGWAPELIIGSLSDPLDPATFTGIDTIALSTAWQEFEVFLDDYTGTDMFIAIKGGFGGTYQDIYIDNITIDHPPTCPKPSDLYAEGATQTSVMVGWEENGVAAEWNIEFDYAGFTPTGIANVIADANPFELTGLEDGTFYEFYVQADCGGGDQSYWVGPYLFQTLCYPTVLAQGEYIEDFENLSPPLVPPCIVVENSNYDDDWWMTSFNNPYAGLSHMLCSYTFNNPMDDWFFSAPLELLGGQTYNVLFYYTCSSTSYTEKLELKFGMEPTADGMTSDPIFVDEEIIYGPDNYQEGLASFTPDEDGVYFVGWHGYSIPGQWDLYVDDIMIEWDNSLVVSASATPDSICEGGESQLNGSAVGGSGSYTYFWTSDPPGFTSNDPDPIVTPTVTTDYILEINDTFVSIYDTVTVHVTQLPGVPTTPTGITFFCASWGNATYTTTGASGANWYDWVLDPEDAGAMTGTGTSVTIDWTEGWLGNATLKVIGMQNECAGPESTGLSVMVYLPDVNLDPFDTACLNWPAFELTGGSPAGGIYSGTGVEDGWFDPMVAGVGDHIITYTYSDAASCENFAEQTMVVDACTGIGEFGNNTRITITPNPNNGIFTLMVKTKNEQKVNIKVMNNFGEEVYKKDNVALHGNYSTEIDLSSYSKGLYYLYIYSDHVNYVEKIVVK